MSEIRYALRTLIKAPGPTIVMMLTLGVAVGAATVIYSVIDLVWHFVPARNQTRLVYAAATDTRVVQAEGDTRSVVMRTPASVPDLADWIARATTFEELAGFRMGSASLTGVEIPVRLTAIRVTANLPDVWGLAPVLGRAFRREEGRTGSGTGHVALQRLLATALLGQSCRPRSDHAARRSAAHHRRRAPA